MSASRRRAPLAAVVLGVALAIVVCAATAHAATAATRDVLVVANN